MVPATNVTAVKCSSIRLRIELGNAANNRLAVLFNRAPPRDRSIAVIGGPDDMKGSGM
jgi:hypothetical protein